MKLTLEQVNKELQDKCFNGLDPYNNLPSAYNYSKMVITRVNSGNAFILNIYGFPYNSNPPRLTPVYRGSLAKCRKEALSRIEYGHLYLEGYTIRRGIPLCYLPHVVKKADHYYPAE